MEGGPRDHLADNLCRDQFRVGVSGQMSAISQLYLNEFEGMAGNDTLPAMANTRSAFYSSLDGVTVVSPLAPPTVSVPSMLSRSYRYLYGCECCPVQFRLTLVLGLESNTLEGRRP